MAKRTRRYSWLGDKNNEFITIAIKLTKHIKRIYTNYYMNLYIQTRNETYSLRTEEKKIGRK